MIWSVKPRFSSLQLF